MLDNQLTLDVIPYSTLYDIIVPKTQFLRQLMELCDFSFIYDELEMWMWWSAPFPIWPSNTFLV